jgi:hypothetical protein
MVGLPVVLTQEAQEANRAAVTPKEDAAPKKSASRSSESSTLSNIGIGAGGFKGSQTDKLRGFAEKLDIEMGEKGTKFTQAEFDAVKDHFAARGVDVVVDGRINAELVKSYATGKKTFEQEPAEVVRKAEPAKEMGWCKKTLLKIFDRNGDGQITLTDPEAKENKAAAKGWRDTINGQEKAFGNGDGIITKAELEKFEDTTRGQIKDYLDGLEPLGISLASGPLKISDITTPKVYHQMQEAAKEAGISN